PTYRFPPVTKLPHPLPTLPCVAEPSRLPLLALVQPASSLPAASSAPRVAR
ncbi:unnamed protein product, partial [Closterium sp. NIES-54]